MTKAPLLEKAIEVEGYYLVRPLDRFIILIDP
jgi:hypothetical protein